jgi:hypothetical protein
MNEDAVFGLFIVAVLALHFYEWDRTFGKSTGFPSPVAFLFIRWRFKRRH